MEQGRLAASHMFGIPFEHMPELFPYGIYTIPEISMVGQTEETLTSNRVPYEVGLAKYSDLAKSMMLGDEAGMLKLLFSPNAQAAWRARPGTARDRNNSYWPGGALLWRVGRILPRRGLQLPDPG